MILTILAAALFSFYFIEMARLHKKWRMDVKPFNCLVCLPAWVALALYLMPKWVTDGVIVMFGAAILSVLLKTIMNKAHESGTH